MIDLLKKNINKDWYEEFCEASPILISLPSHAIGQEMFPLKRQYKLVANFYENNKTHWFTLVKDQDLMFEEMLDNYLRDKNYYIKWFNKWKVKTKKFHKLFDEINNLDFSRINNNKLIELHREFWKLIIDCRRISMIIEPFTFASERHLMKELMDYSKKHKIKELGKIYSILSSPEKPSFNFQHDLELIKIAKTIKNKFNNNSIKKNLKKYCWIRCSWGKAYNYNKQDIIKEIKQLQKLDLEDIEKKKREFYFINIKKKRELFDKYKFNKEIKAISKMTAFFSHWGDLRKENALKFIYAETLFLKEFSKRFNLNFNDLHLFDITEIEFILKNKKKYEDEVKRRKKLFLLIHANHKIDFFFGKSVKDYLKKMSRSIRDISKLKGVCASPGKVKGKVRIIHEGKEFSKFKKGEILVTGMTRPDFIVLMKKSLAIVTNDGGITSHAAVISRELKKPCVIGTRIATKVLKDGDLVEVDANKGVVRKIKNG